LGQFLRFHLVQPSPVDAAFGKQLRGGDALQRFKHLHMKLGMRSHGGTQKTRNVGKIRGLNLMTSPVIGKHSA